jgi:hypothetical protein
VTQAAASAQVRWIDAAASRLLASGYQEIPLNAAGARALRRSDFRIRWFLTRLHTFVLLQPAGVADLPDLQAFDRDASRWAKDAKGGMPRGLQTGIAIIPVLVAASATPAAQAEAARRPRRDWAALKLPVLVALDSGLVSTYGGSMVWGGAYAGFVREQRGLVVGYLG